MNLSVVVGWGLPLAIATACAANQPRQPLDPIQLETTEARPAAGDPASAVVSAAAPPGQTPAVDSVLAMPGRVEPPDTRPEICQSLAFAQLERQIGFPGAGHQLELRLVTQDRVPRLSEDFAACVRVRDELSQDLIPVQVASHPPDTALTLLLVLAGTTEAASGAAQAAAEALIALRPADERIAVYRWADSVVQLDSFGTDRKRTREQLALRLGTSAAPPLPAAQALATVSGELSKIEGDAVAAQRSVVVIAPQAKLDATGVDPAKGAVEVYWVAESVLQAVGANVFVAAAQLNGRLNAERAAGFLRLGLCSDGKPRALRVDLGATAQALSVVLEDNLEEELAGVCDPLQIAADRVSYSDVLRLTFTPEQRVVYDRQVSQQLVEDFAGALQLSAALNPTPVSMHLHGEHSLACARKSFTLDLDRKRGRRLIPSSSTDEYHLVMTCEDELYIHQITAAELFREIGLFPLRSRVIELTVDDRSNGTYLLLEKYKEELLRDHSRITSIIRHRNEALGMPPEVKFAAVDDAAALAEYEQVQPPALRGLRGVELEQTLRERMDLDSYLRWVALQNVLGSGDFVDELILYATETRDPASGRVHGYFNVLAWDADDTFSPCHDSSTNAIFDPNGLLTCVESNFDHFVFADPHIYDLYVDTLEQMLAFATEARFAEALQHTTDALYHFLERADVRAANVEFQDWAPGAATRDDFVNAIAAHAEKNKASLKNNRSALQSRIAAYRATRP